MIPYRVYKEPDRLGPRFRATGYRYNLINKELYQRFMMQDPNVNIDYDVFHYIGEQISLEIIEQVRANREGVILPKGMGRIWLGLFPPKRRTLSETGLIEHNFHSGNMKGKICWDYDFVKYKIENYEYYGFLAHRDFKKVASNAFKNNAELYIRINNLIRAYESRKKRKLEENEQHNRLNNTLGYQSDKDNT